MSEIQEVPNDNKNNETNETENESLIQKIFKTLKTNTILIVSLLIALAAFFYIKNNDATQVLNDSFSPEMNS